MPKRMLLLLFLLSLPLSTLQAQDEPDDEDVQEELGIRIEPASAFLADLIEPPVFGADRLEITTALLAAVESALRKPGRPRPMDGAAMQERLINAKSDAERQRIAAEIERNLRGFQNVGPVEQAHRAFVAAAGSAFAAARAKREQWHRCVGNAGSKEDVRTGQNRTTAQKAALQKAIAEQQQACGPQPPLNATPRPEGWDGSGESFYATLDRALAFCSASDAVAGRDGTVAIDAVPTSWTAFEHTYTPREVTALQKGCSGLLAAIEEANFQSEP